MNTYNTPHNFIGPHWWIIRWQRVSPRYQMVMRNALNAMRCQLAIPVVENNLAHVQSGIFTAHYSDLITWPDNRQHAGARYFQAHFTTVASHAMNQFTAHHMVLRHGIHRGASGSLPVSPAWSLSGIRLPAAQSPGFKYTFIPYFGFLVELFAAVLALRWWRQRILYL